MNGVCRIIRLIASPLYPAASSEAMIEPEDVPATLPKVRPARSVASTAPARAIPLTPRLQILR